MADFNKMQMPFISYLRRLHEVYYMKQTQVLDALRNIKRRFISYQSIAVTVVMGMAGLPCIFFMESSYTQYATDYYTESHFKDFDITSTAGITDDDIKEKSKPFKYFSLLFIYFTPYFLQNFFHFQHHIFSIFLFISS